MPRSKSATIRALRDKPLIIGGGVRGVVSTCCYIARQSGVRSAMPMFKASKLCPDAVIIKPNMAKYVGVSRQIRALMDALTPLVEPLSIDEAFLDLTGTQALHKAPPAVVLARFAKRVEDRDRRHHLGRPQPQQVPRQDRLRSRQAARLRRHRQGRDPVASSPPKPISLIYGVGKVFAETLRKDGFETIGQLQDASARKPDAPLWRNGRPPRPPGARPGQPRRFPATAR